MRKTITAVSVLGILFLSGCSIFRSATETVTIKTNVPDADIYVNTVPVGKSPVSTSVKRNRVISIVARKQGYEPTARSIDYHLNGTGAADIVGTFTCLFPAIGLVSPGIYSLDETEIYLYLVEAQNKD